MFNFSWSELALILVVALIAIGPKDMPAAIRAVTDVIRKMRRMAGEFQGQVDELVREANLSEVRDSLNELRNIDVPGRIRDTIDADGTLRSAFDDPLAETHGEGTLEGEETIGLLGPPEPPAHPALVPPDFVPPGTPPPLEALEAAGIGPPAFVPPQIARG
ncbi:MAG: Sec-independent protein translocase protein TatB [Acetobacteraceae bacterium]